MQHNDSDTFTSMPSPSPYDPSPVTAFAPSPSDYDLDLIKRSNGQGATSLHQHGLSSSGAAHLAETITSSNAGKKARFVSDSNIPSALGMGLLSTGAPSYLGQPQLHQQQLQQQDHHQQQPQHQHQHQQSQQKQQQQQHQPSGQPQQPGISAAGSVDYPGMASSGFAGAGRHFGQGSGSLPAGVSLYGTQTMPYSTNANLVSNGTNAGYNSGMASTSQPPYLMAPSASPIYTGYPPAGYPQMAGAAVGFVPGVGMASHPQNQEGRTVYVGNLPEEASVDELLNHVKFGPIENVRVLPEKNCAFISFLDGPTAASFHADASVKKLSLHGQELKIGWGRISPVPQAVLVAVQQHQATRNVYVQLGQDENNVTEESLRDDLAHFGPIDQVKIVRDKNIGFVHFLSISTAMKVVSQLPQESQWAGKRVNYGKDRCAYVPRSQQQNQAHNNQAAVMSMAAAASLGYPTAFGFRGTPGGAGADGNSSASSGPSTASLEQMGNRTVYLGNIHPETTTEEICNHVRGGILQTVRHIPDKHIAFVTFVDANSALTFHHLASYAGIMIHNRRLKIGWGNHSGPLSPAIAMAVQAGCSRNVYVGNIEDAEFLTAEKLRHDFSEHGDVELVNSLREKNCAFVNFCNIQNAIKAIEAMKSHPDYQTVKISHGKDRCGRSMQLHNGNNGGNNGATGGSGGGDRRERAPRKSSSGNGQGRSAEATPPPSQPDGTTTQAINGGGNGRSGSGSDNKEADDGRLSPSAHDMPPIDSASVGASTSPVPAKPARNAATVAGAGQ